MNANVNYIGCETGKMAGRESIIKLIIAKLGKALYRVTTFEADAIFKSKDWPCLWKK